MVMVVVEVHGVEGFFITFSNLKRQEHPVTPAAI